jgi:hypothetical protein
LSVEAGAQLNSTFEKYQCLQTWNYTVKGENTVPRILAVHPLNGSTYRQREERRREKEWENIVAAETRRAGGGQEPNKTPEKIWTSIFPLSLQMSCVL